MKKILVPTDFSADAENALVHAVELAKEFGSTVLVMNSFTMPYTNSSVIISMTDILRQNAEEDLQNMQKEFVKKHDVGNVEFKMEAILGEVHDAVNTVSKRDEIDLVVMGTKGATGLKAALFGSNTASVIRRIPTPVLAVPEDAKYKRPENIVLATDYKLTKSKKPLRFLANFVSHLAAELTILNVRKNEDDLPQFHEALDSVKEDLNLDELKHNYNVIENEDVEEGINDHFKEYGGDILTLVTHNYSAMEKLFHKSHTKEIALHTKMPLLALQEDEK